MMASVILGLVIGVVIAAVTFVRHRYSLWKRLNIPYLEPTFPYGNTKKWDREKHYMFIHQEYYKQYKGKSPLLGIFLHLNPAAIITDLDLIKRVLIKDFNIFNHRGMYFNEESDPLSANLASLHGQKWKLLRSKMTPTFTSGKMKFMFPTVVEVAQRLQKRLGELADEGKNVEIKDVLSRFTTDVISTCAFGIECDTLNNKNEEFRYYGQKQFDSPRNPIFIRSLLGTMPSVAKFFRVKVNRDDVAKFYTNVVTDVISYRDKNQVQRNDFLNIMMNLRASEENPDGLTLNEILAQAFVMFLAGFETSSTLMNYILYELAANPEIQEKTRNHINSVLEKHNNEVTYEMLAEMKYLDCVVNETLRKNPPAPATGRVAEEDYKVPDTNMLIPKGTRCFIPIYAIHHDEEFYPNPEKFNPDNFTDEAVAKRHPMTFLPFGDGPRNCIGLRFATMETKLGIIFALRKFKYSLTPGTKYPIEFKLGSSLTAPKDKIFLKVERI